MFLCISLLYNVHNKLYVLWRVHFFSVFTLQVDRSPTGSGVTARIAVQFHKKQIQLGKVIFHV